MLPQISHIFAFLGILVTASKASRMRYMFYFDRDHLTSLPDYRATRLSTHAILAYEDPDLFSAEAFEPPKPFISHATVQASFEEPVKVCLSIGGRDRSRTFWDAASSQLNRTRFARNVKTAMDTYEYDCLEISWSQPGGNGDDYNLLLVGSSDSMLLNRLLSTIKETTKKELFVVLPGRDRDMAAFDKKTVRQMAKIVDHVTVKSFDLADLRDPVSNHSAGFHAVGESLERYIDLGVPSVKLNMAFSYYATWRRTEPEAMCLISTICPILQGGRREENMGFVTFEKQNFEPKPPGLDPVIAASFQKAMQEGHIDLELGGWWYWDLENNLFWSWDTADIIYNKCLSYVPRFGLGGLASYSAPMDSRDWRRMIKTASGVAWIPGEFFEDLEQQLAEAEKKEQAHEEL
ncbi:glycoside hydrolase family 18 protein [Pyrenophora teres f. maculata]|nr:glycoside hydrolase family 18 protein [Pyrenophora teres f. maculata]CAA9967178.1 glycoside hydrolase family 18 protein [Pyrenophora teres f. maculata]